MCERTKITLKTLKDDKLSEMFFEIIEELNDRNFAYYIDGTETSFEEIVAIHKSFER